MATDQNEWRSKELLAYTERDGPGRPPAGPSAWLTGTLAAVLGVTFVGLLFSDTLCPDHRAWVQTLAVTAVLMVGSALVALWRGWAAAPMLTLVASALGVAIGLIDTIHSPARGQLVAMAFGLVTVIAAMMTVKSWKLARPDRDVADRDVADRDVADESIVDHVPAPLPAPRVLADEAAIRT